MRGNFMKKNLILVVILILNASNLDALSFWNSILLKISPNTLMFNATQDGDIEALISCMSKADINGYDWHGRTAVQHALLNNNSEVIKILLENGADINACYKQDKLEYKQEDTLLHYAAENGDFCLVDRLIHYGADIKAMTKTGITPYIRAYERGHQEICALLKEHEAYTILDAVRCGDLETTIALLPNNKNLTTSSGSTLLHIAAIHGHVPIIELLLAEGADVNVRDDAQWSSLHTVIMQCRKPEVVELLIQYGADVFTSDDKGWTPLHLAMLLPNVEIVKLLIGAGSPMNAQSKDGCTPLDLILSLFSRSWSFLEEKQVVEYLRSIGAKTNKINESNT